MELDVTGGRGTARVCGPALSGVFDPVEEKLRNSSQSFDISIAGLSTGRLSNARVVHLILPHRLDGELYTHSLSLSIPGGSPSWLPLFATQFRSTLFDLISKCKWEQAARGTVLHKLSCQTL